MSSFYWIHLFWSGCKKDSIHWKWRKNPPKEKLCEAWQQEAKGEAETMEESQRNNKRTFTELSKWLDQSSKDDQSSKELKATSAYLFESQVEVNSQLFKAHYRNVVKDRAEILKHTTMLNGTLAAAWRIRHEILKLEIARLPERYHKMAWSLVRHVYFKILGNRQLVDLIFNNMIKVALENSNFWENMQTLERSASTIEENYKAFVSAALKCNNNNFTYQYPAQYHAEIPVEIPKRRHERHVQRPTERHCNRRSRDQREPNNNNRPREYEHLYAFMATMVDPNTDSLGDDDESVHPSREPVETPGTYQKYFSTETEEELYEENKKLHTVF